MAVTSWGYNGPLYQENWARLAANLGDRYVVDKSSGVDPFGVVAIAGSRRISVGAGTATAAGVLCELPNAEIIDLPTIAAGTSRFYLAVLRRIWGESPSSSLQLLYYSAAANVTAPTAKPSTMPEDFRSQPGVVDDQPLSWVWFNGSNNTVVVLDMRFDLADAAVALSGGYGNESMPLKTSLRNGLVALSGRVSRGSGTSVIVGTVTPEHAPTADTPFTMVSVNPGNVPGPRFYGYISAAGVITLTQLDGSWTSGTFISFNATWAH